jgi:regulatory protein
VRPSTLGFVKRLYAIGPSALSSTMLTNPASLKSRALRLLSRREYSRAELEHRLQPFEETPGSLAQALDELQAKGWISAQRVIESVLHRRLAQWGTARIKRELQDKKLDPQAIHQALAALSTSDLERALALWRKKFGAAPGDLQQAARQTRFLAARGFDAQTIHRVLKVVAQESPSSPTRD